MVKGRGGTRQGSLNASLSQITGLRNSNDKSAIISTLSMVSGMADATRLHTGYTVNEVKAALKKTT